MRKILTACLILPLAVSCSAANQGSIETATTVPTNTAVLPTMTLPPTETPIPPTPTPDYVDEICSPLYDITLEELTTSDILLQQPFIEPAIGKDDGHHGVDFAFYRFKDYVGIEGLPIQAALEGEVVTILNDRLPYGYAVIIETPLNNISPDLLAAMQLPEEEATVEPKPNVNCPPTGELDFTLSEDERSLYILYAHMLEYPSVQVGEHVTCGQTIGAVGNSGEGFSTNPHLHFETRVGPSGARFESMAYYTVQSTEAERYNYCVWRVINLFQLFDPMTILSVQN